MHRNLGWKEVGIETKIVQLYGDISHSLHESPSARSSERDKLAHWVDKLEQLLEKIHAIHVEVTPLLERDIKKSIVSGEILELAMFQPSTKNLFSEIELYVERGETCILTPYELRELAFLSEGAKTLAWVGDAALNLAVLTQLWMPSVMSVGELTERRKEYVQNANLARLCDRWKLYEHRLHFDPPSDPTIVTRETVDHIKGTLVEAIFGILFLAEGLTGVAEVISLLRPHGSVGDI